MPWTAISICRVQKGNRLSVRYLATRRRLRGLARMTVVKKVSEKVSDTFLPPFCLSYVFPVAASPLFSKYLRTLGENPTA